MAGRAGIRGPGRHFYLWWRPLQLEVHVAKRISRLQCCLERPSCSSPVCVSCAVTAHNFVASSESTRTRLIEHTRQERGQATGRPQAVGSGRSHEPSMRGQRQAAPRQRSALSPCPPPPLTPGSSLLAQVGSSCSWALLRRRLLRSCLAGHEWRHRGWRPPEGVHCGY